MKSTRKKYLPNTAKEEFFEAFQEILFWLGVMAIALAIAFLFPDEVLQNIPFEIFLLPGFIVCMAICLTVIFLLKKRKKSNTPKIHKNLNELFEDILASAPTAVLEDKSIKLFASESTLKIKMSDGFITYLNDKPEEFIVSKEDIYSYALEFMHDNVKPHAEIEIDDTRFIKSDKNGNLFYKDYFERIHTLPVLEYEFEMAKKSCIFRKNGVDIKVNFSDSHVTKKENRLLSGSRKRRLEKLISIVKEM